MLSGHGVQFSEQTLEQTLVLFVVHLILSGFYCCLLEFRARNTVS